MRVRSGLMVAVVGWLLACSGAVMVPDMPGNTPGEDDDEDEDEDDGELVAKKPLPQVEPDEEPRPDDCTSDPYTDAEVILEETQSNGGTPVVDRSPNRVVETVVMANGMEVRVTRGGCAHFGETWEVSPAPKGAWVAAAKKVLKKVDTADEPAVLMCLNKAPDPPPQSGWSAGDSNCTIALEDGVLTFAYDFAL